MSFTLDDDFNNSSDSSPKRGELSPLLSIACSLKRRSSKCTLKKEVYFCYATLNIEMRVFAVLFSFLISGYANSQTWNWVKRGPGARTAAICGSAITLDRFL